MDNHSEKENKKAEAAESQTITANSRSSSSSSSSERSRVQLVSTRPDTMPKMPSSEPSEIALQAKDAEALQSSSAYNDLTEKPAELSSNELAEASQGVNRKDAERNENFDGRFYKNQIAVRQHNSLQRPKTFCPDSSVLLEDEAEFYVIAKRVAEPVDEICWITVKQSKHMGSGRFSDVFAGEVVVGNKHSTAVVENQVRIPVAIKKLWPDKSREDLQICTHRLLHHHNIVSLLFYYVCVHPKSKVLVWMMILEQMPSTLTIEQAKYIDRQRFMPRVFVKLFAYQLLSGLGYMERKSILHRDIKPDNLLVDMQTGRLKIGDLGSSKMYHENRPSSAYVVTRYYRAPELCLKYKFYSPTVDVWSAGCILCGMMTNRVLFYGRSNADQLQQIFKVCGTPTREQMRQCAPGITLKSFSSHYPSANWYRILHRFNDKITMACADFVTKVLRYETESRLRGDAALNHEFFDSLREPGRLLPNGNPMPYLSR